MTTPAVAPYALPDTQLLAQCQSQAVLGSGPGGQHRNRTASAVRLVHLASGIDARCEEHRERRRNLVAATFRLRIRLALSVRGRSDRDWLSQLGQVPHSSRSPHYPQVVACCLDALEASRGSLPEAAAALGLSSSRLARILTADKEVHSATNLLRAGHGCGAIHG
jgi:hypothetical protein